MQARARLFSSALFPPVSLGVDVPLSHRVRSDSTVVSQGGLLPLLRMVPLKKRIFFYSPLFAWRIGFNFSSFFSSAWLLRVGEGEGAEFLLFLSDDNSFKDRGWPGF